MPNRQSRSRYARTASAIGIALLAGSLTISAHAAEQDAEKTAGPGAFTVKNGKVDPNTYQGYIVYTRSCQACHGPDGLGSSFAPSLVKAAERRSFAEFARTIAGGLQIRPGRVMPSFADDEYVLGNIGNIYSYLKARGSGKLDRGRPDVIEAMQQKDAQE